MNRCKLLLFVICFPCLTLLGQTRNGALHLFHDEMKTNYPSVVYDFLERYLYTVSNSTDGFMLRQQMADDKVFVTSGSLSNIKRISPNSPFSLLRHEDVAYDVSWTDESGNILLGLQFPIKYELLLGQPKVDIEKTMPKLLEMYSSSFEARNPTSSYEALSDGYFSSSPVSKFYVESLTTATYYQKGTGETVIPVFSSKQKWYSSANLFQGLIADIADYRLYVEQNLYGFNQQTYTIPLARWLNYCKENNLTVYYAIEEEREDGLKALLIAQNRDLGFNHLLSIIIPDNFTEKKNSVLKAKLNAFIPTDNVKDLYQQYVNKPKKQL